jgi:hypothetical protein
MFSGLLYKVLESELLALGGHDNTVSLHLGIGLGIGLGMISGSFGDTWGDLMISVFLLGGCHGDLIQKVIRHW